MNFVWMMIPGVEEAGIDEEAGIGVQAERMLASNLSLQAHKCAQPTHLYN